MKLMAGNSNLPLARAIAAYLEIPLTDASVRRFADEEIFIEIHENVRGEDLFILQSTSYPANDNLMELLIGIDACRRASAKRITAVLPYFGYARQDRKPGPAHADLGQARRQPDHRGGADRCFRSTSTRGRSRASSISRPTTSTPRRRWRSTSRSATRRGPDGRLARRRRRGRARALAKRLDNAPLAIVDKRRERPGESEGDEHHRRREGPLLHPRRRHHRFGRHAVQRGAGADGRRARAASPPISPTACCRAARSRGSTIRR
jgi:ribose-phosphate pyrophosphokinase